MRSNSILSGLKGSLCKSGAFMKKFGHAVRQTASQRIAAVSALTVIASVVMGVAALSLKSVIIHQDGDYQILRTFCTETDDILEEANIELSIYDELLETENPAFYKDLTIHRAFTVSLTCDGQRTFRKVTGGDVQTLLSLNGVTLGEDDLISNSLSDSLCEDINVTVQRVSYETVTEEVSIPFGTQQEQSQLIARGRTKLLQEGEAGVGQTTVENRYVDGQLQEVTLLEDIVLKAPVDEKVAIGVGTLLQTSRGDVRSSYYVDMTATAYTYGEGGSWGDVTYSGKSVKVGYVAVDPRVIPLGSRLYITYPSGKVAYGYAVAEDTGGSIKGNRIDLFFDSYQQCINFGIRKVRVYVLD